MNEEDNDDFCGLMVAGLRVMEEMVLVKRIMEAVVVIFCVGEEGSGFGVWAEKRMTEEMGFFLLFFVVVDFLCLVLFLFIRPLFCVFFVFFIGNKNDFFFLTN